MADFCTRCSEQMGFRTPDIDLVAEAQDLKPNHCNSPAFLCEGCGYITLFNVDGVIRVDSGLDMDTEVDIKTLPTLDEFLKTEMPNY